MVDVIAPAHLKIGAKALDDTSINSDFKIYRKIYLFGCIAPDINFIYPFHNIICTPKRFQKRIMRMGKIKSKIIRSFTLGVIMHYLCDYFCLAHNNNSYGAKHTLYERLMSHRITTNSIPLECDMQSIKDYWKLAVEKYESGETTILDDIAVQHSIDCEEIFRIVKSMNGSYKEAVKSYINNGWYNDNKQMQFDVSWALFMCEKVSLLIYNNVGIRVASI